VILEYLKDEKIQWNPAIETEKGVFCIILDLWIIKAKKFCLFISRQKKLPDQIAFS